MKLDALIKRRAAIEEQIRQEQAAERRRKEVAAIIEKQGALFWPDGDIVAAITAASEGRRHVADA